MANGHGGYRKPANPAPVSGPGAMSRRTDGAQPVMDIPSDEYGGLQANREIQAGATMAQAQSIQLAPQPITGLGEPTAMPNQPVTNGAAYGPGAGPMALGMIDPNQEDAAYYRKYLPVLLKQADDPSTPPGYKRLVRTLLANLK